MKTLENMQTGKNGGLDYNINKYLNDKYKLKL